jgi:hypothetical protein
MKKVASSKREIKKLKPLEKNRPFKRLRSTIKNPHLKGVLGCGRSEKSGDVDVLRGADGDGADDDGAGICACRTTLLAQSGRRGSLLVSEGCDGESLAFFRSRMARGTSWSSFC